MESSSVGADHLAPTQLNASYMSRWKALFNNLDVPKNQHLQLMVSWAQEWADLKIIISYLIAWISLVLEPRIEKFQDHGSPINIDKLVPSEIFHWK